MPHRRSVSLRLALCAMLAALAAGVAVLAVGVALPTASAAAPAAAFTVYDYGFNAASNSTQVTIAPGQSVAFAYPTGGSRHNVDFGSGPQPTSCTLDGAAVGSAPMPASPTAPGWSGSCEFDTPGTYTFHCDLHPMMVGTVVVAGAGTTTSATTPPATSTATMTMVMPTSSTPAATTSTPTTTSTPMTAMPGMTMSTPATSGAPSPPSGATLKPTSVAVSVNARQQRTAVQVTLTVPSAATGDRARLVLRAGRTTLGSLTAAKLHAGTTKLTLHLNRAGQRLVHAAKSQRATLTATFSIPSGRQRTTTRTVVLHHA